MGLTHSPSELQKLLLEIFAPCRDRLQLSWLHVDDFLLVGRPKQLRQALTRLLVRLRASNFIVNKDTSILKPVKKLDYLGMTLDFIQQRFGPTKQHRKMSWTMLRATKVPPRLHSKKDLHYRGFLAFTLSVSVSIFAILKMDWRHLRKYLYYNLTVAALVNFPWSRWSRTVFVDATPTALGILSHDFAWHIPFRGSQMLNELLEFLITACMFPRARILSDNYAALSLCKRDQKLIRWKLFVSSVNPHAPYVCSCCN